MSDEKKPSGPSSLQLALRRIAAEPEKIVAPGNKSDDDLMTAITEWESASDPEAKAKAFRAALKIAQLNN